MQLNWSDGDVEFREQVRSFVRSALPQALRDKVLGHQWLDKADYVQWQRILHARGWMGWAWPVAHGGTGWSDARKHIFEEECWLAGAPEVPAFGVKMLAPLIMNFGNAQQKAQVLPRILSCEDWWCQGYSEPGAGSDLASLRTTARRSGDHFILQGQKTWTSYAQYANKMFCLVRTDPAASRQAGISFLLFDMDLPGITVRPIELLDGHCEVNEVFFDDVKVPSTALLGELDKGWTYAKALLGHERVQAGKIGRSKRELRLLKRLAAQRQRNGRALLQDDRFAERIVRAEVDLLALECMTLRLIAHIGQGRGAGVEASVLKIRGTEVAQTLSTLLVDVLGEDLHGPQATHDPAVDPQALAGQYLNWRKLSIYGGSNEIQRNLIAKLALGL